MYHFTSGIISDNKPIQTVIDDKERGFGIKIYKNDEVYDLDIDDTRHKWNILVFKSGVYAPDMGYKNSGLYVAPIVDLQEGLSVGENFKGYLLSIPFTSWSVFDINNLEGRFLSIHFKPFVELGQNEADNLIMTMDVLDKSLKADVLSYNEVESVFLCRAFIAAVSRHFSMQPPTHYLTKTGNRYVDGFLLLVAKHCLEEKKLDFYAEQLGITSKYLSSAVAKTTGKKANKWISDSVIQEANKHLRLTSSQINNIAEKVGFANSSDFCRYYRSHTGITPMQYRRECLRQSLMKTLESNGVK